MWNHLMAPTGATLAADLEADPSASFKFQRLREGGICMEDLNVRIHDPLVDNSGGSSPFSENLHFCGPLC